VTPWARSRLRDHADATTRGARTRSRLARGGIACALKRIKNGFAAARTFGKLVYEGTYWASVVREDPLRIMRTFPQPSAQPHLSFRTPSAPSCFPERNTYRARGGNTRLDGLVGAALVLLATSGSAAAQSPSERRFDAEDGLVFVQGSIGSSTGLHFLIDTGTSWTLVDRRLVTRLGLSEAD
jgi:hypothetical protein